MPKNIGIVISRFNGEITKDMKKYALERAKKTGLKVAEVIEVTGAFEVPFAVQLLLEKQGIHGVATVGAVVKGETGHDEVIVHSVAGKILELSLKYKKPVSLGIIGPNATWEQAVKRKREYAERSVDAVAGLLRIQIKSK